MSPAPMDRASPVWSAGSRGMGSCAHPVHPVRGVTGLGGGLFRPVRLSICPRWKHICSNNYACIACINVSVLVDMIVYVHMHIMEGIENIKHYVGYVCTRMLGRI